MSRTALSVTDYAATFQGVCQLALDELKENRQLATITPDDAGRMIYTGRMQAWASVIKLATGRPGLDSIALEILHTMGVDTGVDGAE